MPRAITLKRAAEIYQDRAYALLRYRGKEIRIHRIGSRRGGIRSYEGKISVKHLTGLNIKIDLLDILSDDAKILRDCLHGVSQERGVPEQVSKYIIAQANNILVPLKPRLRTIVFGTHHGKKLFDWPEALKTSPDPHKTNLIESLRWIWDVYFDYYSVATEDEAKKKQPVEKTLPAAFNLFHGPLYPEILDDVLEANQRYDLSDKIPKAVSRVFTSLLHGACITTGLGVGAAAWHGVDVPHFLSRINPTQLMLMPFDPISPEDIGRFAKLRV